MFHEDEPPPPPLTLDGLFLVYANFKTNPLDAANETYDEILLSQIDVWMEKAELAKKVFTQTETGLAFMRFKRWRISFEEFIEFIMYLCTSKDLQYEFIVEKLIEAGPPTAIENMTVVR